jgi:type IV pilus assembly protein PilA
MLYRLRQRSQDEGGFTLIELLVVILIIGILAAIAIPSFLSQKGKAYDAGAKELARTAYTTMETYATDHEGKYTGATLAELHGYESSIPLNQAAAKGGAYLEEPVVAAEEFKVTAVAAHTADTFTITRLASGEVNRTCVAVAAEAKTTGCPTAAKTW